ncbi:hypothetical protein J40TS1_48640 [Paenibacillus montaniterrae]|uniref:DUF3887 domain-containing protein n=1 Tax=Paenibacillus montaniterrae TaxID=429341 RepID=A0A920CWE8_9BACL|nr:DUF3887 domain-containing protein [Paenibacillus montaniterrae]GIP19222.1 hypothetical protein J40TS1_48640 [Paenibacillus montaniterrae]
MKKMHVMFISICVLVLLAGCGSKVDDSTAQTYISKAEEVVQMLNNGEYESITEQFDDTMKASLSAEQLAELEPLLTASGEFKAIEKQSVEEKDGMKIVVLIANYSEEKRIFTITYDANDKIAGLFIK